MKTFYRIIPYNDTELELRIFTLGTQKSIEGYQNIVWSDIGDVKVRSVILPSGRYKINGVEVNVCMARKSYVISSNKNNKNYKQVCDDLSEHSLLLNAKKLNPTQDCEVTVEHLGELVDGRTLDNLICLGGQVYTNDLVWNLLGRTNTDIMKSAEKVEDFDKLKIDFDTISRACVKKSFETLYAQKDLLANRVSIMMPNVDDGLECSVYHYPGVVPITAASLHACAVFQTPVKISEQIFSWIDHNIIKGSPLTSVIGYPHPPNMTYTIDDKYLMLDTLFPGAENKIVESKKGAAVFMSSPIMRHEDYSFGIMNTLYNIKKSIFKRTICRRMPAASAKVPVSVLDSIYNNMYGLIICGGSTCSFESYIY